MHVVAYRASPRPSTAANPLRLGQTVQSHKLHATGANWPSTRTRQAANAPSATDTICKRLALQEAGLSLNTRDNCTSADVQAAYGRYARCVKRQLYLAYLEAGEDVGEAELDEMRDAQRDASTRLQASREHLRHMEQEAEGVCPPGNCATMLTSLASSMLYSC